MLVMIQSFRNEKCKYLNLSNFKWKILNLQNKFSSFRRRWARSTLVLVPLFGVHYTVFLGMSYSMGVNETVELVWLFCDQLFASFQVWLLFIKAWISTLFYLLFQFKYFLGVLRGSLVLFFKWRSSNGSF